MKRLLDIAISVTMLVILSPVLALVGLAIRLTMGNPILFRQKRPGLEGELFEILKFRTMRESIDSTGKPMSDDARLTSLGRLLRSTSLDELPELVNVLRGEMSLVGPRPLLPEYLALYDERQARRNELLPGITGWAQVNGRNAISWEEKFEMDVWYVDNHSLKLDMQILFRTAVSVVKRTGIGATGTATAHRFTGHSASKRGPTST